MIDSHCHLDLDAFDSDRTLVIGRAKAAGITKMLSLACTDNLADTKTAELLNAYDFIYSSIGIHPHRADSFSPESRTNIKKIVNSHKRFVAIGEIGLDFYYNASSRDMQQKVFREQIELALELQLPIIVHVRDAFIEAHEIIASYCKNNHLRGVIHCFTGTREHAQLFLDLGFSISFSGILTFKKTDALKETCKHVPLDRILIETDAPFLAPVPFRGKRNEPAYVKYIAEEVARIKNKTLEEIDTITEENTKCLFGL